MLQEEVRETLAAGYAAGSLDPALRLLADAQSAVAPPGRQILTHVRPSIGPHEDFPTAEAKTLTEELSFLPAVIQDAAIRAQASRKWKSPISGLQVLSLDINDSAEASLLRVLPMAAVPQHTHEGAEYALVLTGAFDDGIGRYLVGDISIADSTITHQPRAEDGEVCWVLVIRYGKLRWTGLLGVLQRLFRR